MSDLSTFLRGFLAGISVGCGLAVIVIQLWH